MYPLSVKKVRKRMLKAKVCFFAAACMAGIISLSPITAMAAETDTESVTLSEKDRNQSENQSAFKEKLQQSREKWNTLSAKQKEEVYSLIEARIQTENKLMDKLVELGVMQKADTDKLKAHMSDKFKKMKESGEFPMMRFRGRKDNE
jgi:hypothetical protein